MKQLAFLLAALVGCADDDSPAGCDGKVVTAMSTGAGTIEATGEFGQGQPILEIVAADGSTRDFVSSPYDASHATFAGLPSGLHEVRWILSCFHADGQVTVRGPSTIDVP